MDPTYRTNMGIYWNQPLSNLPQDTRKNFANALKSCWSAIAMSMDYSEGDITSIKRLKSGKSDVEYRAAKHFIKHERNHVLEHLYVKLQQDQQGELAIQLMRSQYSFNPPDFLTILNRPLHTLMKEASFQSLTKIVCSKLMSHYDSNEVSFALYGYYRNLLHLPVESDFYMWFFIESQHIQNWMESDQCTIRSLISVSDSFCAENLNRNLYDLLNEDNKLDCIFDIFLITARNSLINIQRTDLSGDFLSIPAPILNRNLTNLLTKEFIEKLLADDKRWGELMENLTSLFPSWKICIRKCVHFYKNDKDLFLSMYNDSLNMQNAFRAPPITVRQLILSLNVMGATAEIESIKKELNISVSASPSNTSQKDYRLSSHVASSPVGKKKNDLIEMLNSEKVNFLCFFQEFQNIASPEEVSFITYLSLDHSASQMMVELMDRPTFTFGRLEYCLSSMNATRAVERMYDIALE